MPSPTPLPAVGVGEPPGRGFVPLGQLADIKIAGGPPMVRDEGGLLVGYVYVDIDQDQRDIGGYVNEAKQVVQQGTASGDLKLPQGYFLKWTGQYEQLAEMSARMKIAIPVTFMIIFVLLFLNFGNLAEVLIILLSIPFALVGSAWVLWLLDYRLSTAVWVGVIALVGLAAQTGIVMIVYIDNAYERRRSAGMVRNLEDIIWAQRAADEAKERRIRLVHHAESNTLFATFDITMQTLKKVNRKNLGFLYDECQWMVNTKDYRPDLMVSNIKAVSPWLWNVYVKNQVGGPGPTNRPETKLSDAGGVDFAKMFDGLKAINYSGYVTVHESNAPYGSAEEAARQCHWFLKSFISLGAAKP